MADGDPSNQDKIVTAIDIVDQQTALEKEANEILPENFEACTFDKGYIRQPLYACKTCSHDNTEPAAMCYSCSIACHADHELFELFAKRNFRCDCGIENKFGDHRCQLSSLSKQQIASNDKNTYNHNFFGHYCRCDKFYDPAKDECTMYQCVLCEDWFHEECIGDIPPEIEDFESYVCRDCVDRYPFLVQQPSTSVSIGLSRDNAKIHKWLFSQPPSNDNNTTHDSTIPADTTTTNHSGEKRKEPTSPQTNAPDPKRVKSDPECKKEKASYADRVELFFNDGWREKLCQCDTCKKAFVENGIEFLLSEEDTFEPEQDEDAGKSLLEMGMEQMNHMDRVQAIEGIIAYKKFATQIKEFLRGFAGSGEVVTPDDIRRFFEERDPENRV
ncbi:e3 ubiquitin-protein ligase ubr7 [Lichtheimia corymbifera JMRC:FSU:9682]|uniref:E3 ubiquitin-protein ligase ubr7 n=1 Tax=Lichtheimia corymbifera JMRC:FSU:9682 TaxID=1263082 RepID=A0A068SHB5_9FUNG|nr:e3 ubiquitin-protein ligase ubr7 [Lichtheimia corymbifera JMRC:FSU:9682]